MGKSTILVETETRRMLKDLGKKAQTYDQVIKELIQLKRCRVEEAKQPKKPAVEFISDVFNPMEKIAKQLSGISRQIDKLARFQASTDCLTSNWRRGY